jgi:hypothetical protein
MDYARHCWVKTAKYVRKETMEKIDDSLIYQSKILFYF